MWFRRLRKKRVIIHLKSGLTIDGVLIKTYRSEAVLRSTNLRDGQNAPTEMGGEVRILKENILFAQTTEG